MQHSVVKQTFLPNKAHSLGSILNLWTQSKKSHVVLFGKFTFMQYIYDTYKVGSLGGNVIDVLPQGTLLFFGLLVNGLKLLTKGKKIKRL